MTESSLGRLKLLVRRMLRGIELTAKERAEYERLLRVWAATR